MNEYQRRRCTALSMLCRFRSNASACCLPRSEAVEGHARVLFAAPPPTAAPPPSSPVHEASDARSVSTHMRAAQHNLLSTARWIFMQAPQALPLSAAPQRCPAPPAAAAPPPAAPHKRLAVLDLTELGEQRVAHDAAWGQKGWGWMGGWVGQSGSWLAI